MIHPFVFVLRGLLTSSAVLGGHLPAALLLLVDTAFVRRSSEPASPLIVVLAAVFAVLQLAATFVVNILVCFLPEVRAELFGRHRIVTESFGVYEAGPGRKGWILAGACVPSGLLLLYIFFSRKKLLRRGAGRCLPRPRLAVLSWIVASTATALLAPTVLGGVFLLIGMVASVSVELGAGRLLFRRTPRRHTSFPFLLFNVCSTCGVFVGCILLVITCAAQNVAVAYSLGAVDPMYGLSKLSDQPLDVALCHLAQLFMMMTTLFLAQMTLEWRGLRSPSHSAEPVFLDQASTEGICAENVSLLHHDDISSQQPLLMHNDSTAADGFCERLVSALGRAGAWFAQALLASSRIIPLALMAANMVVFPSVVSLSLLPTMMIGQLLRRSSFVCLLRLTVLFFFFLVLLQYVVLVTEVVQPDIVRRLFLGNGGRWLGLTQVICSAVLFLVMSAADVVVSYRASLERLLGTSHYYHHSYRDGRCSDHGGDDEGDEDEGGVVRLSDSSQGDDEAMLRHQNTGGGSVGNVSSPFLGVRRSAEHVLGAQRVSELLAYVSRDSLDSSESFEQLFLALVGRRPFVEESQCLCRDAIGDVILREKMHACQEPLLYLYRRWFRLLVTRHAALPVLLHLFIVGSFTYYMDILHAIVLVLFLLHFAFPSSLNGRSKFVLAYLMFLTSFELLFRFLSDFFVLPIYIACGPMQYATVGLVPLRHRREAIPYILAVFVVAFITTRASVCRSWGDVVSLHEWNRFCRTAATRQWWVRVTMTTATGVFLAVGLFLSYSLVAEGFLVLFFILGTAAAFLGVSSPVLGVLWYVACAYNILVALLSSTCQFTQLSSLLEKYVWSRLCGPGGSLYETAVDGGECWRDIGLYPTRDDTLLTFFLAPFFLALLTTVTHIAARRTRGAGEERDGGERHLNDQQFREVGGGNERRREEGDGESQREGHEQREGSDDQSSYGPLESALLPSINSNDQRFLRHAVKFIEATNTAGRWLVEFAADYAGILVWVALVVAATHRFNVMNAVYILFFFFDFTHLFVLVYCVLHICAVYTYQLSFVPQITYHWRGVPLEALIGLQKYEGTSHWTPVIGPMFVFLAMLLRIHTRGANDVVRRRQGTEEERCSTWRDILHTRFFYHVGYEALLLTLLVAFSLSSDSCSGVVIGVALLLLFVMDRPRFYHLFLSWILFFLLALSVAWQYLLQLNAAQDVFSVDAVCSTAGAWCRWVFKAHTGTFAGALVGMMFLHTNRQQAKDSSMLFSTLRSRFNGHVTLVDFVRAASVRSLWRLPRDAFDRVVPRFTEALPPSCFGCVAERIIVLFSYLSPVALLSFVTGVTTHSSIINLLLLIGALLQVSRYEAQHWRFFSLWPAISTVVYLFFITLPLICNAPYVVDLLTRHISLSEAIGVMRDGRAFQLSPLHVTLLFFVALQTRVYNDFRFANIVRHLYSRAYTRHKRHEEMQAWLRLRNQMEQELAEARRQALQEKLNEIRSTLRTVNDNWEDLGNSFAERPAKIEPSRRRDEEKKTVMMVESQRVLVDDTAEPQGGGGRHLGGSVSSDMKANDAGAPLGNSGRRAQLFKFHVHCAIHQAATTAANWLASHTYEPHRHTQANYRNVYTRLFGAALGAAEHSTLLLTLLVTMINFMLTRCVWELFPFCFILLIANAYTPFPPRFVFVLLSFYVALGILIKALISVVLSQVSCSPRLLNVLSWTIVHTSEGAVKGQWIGYSYLMMDFIVYAALLAHQDICLANGVYSQKDILLSREGEEPIKVTEATTTTRDALFSSFSTCPPSSTNDGTRSAAPTAFGPTQHVAAVRHKLSTCVSEFVRSATFTPGVGRDGYVYYITVEAVALLTFVLGYNKMTSGHSDSLRESVKRNLLPGPMVIVVFLSIFLLIVDRMLYVRRCMKGKVLLNTMSGVIFCVCYLLWGNLVMVRSRTVGNVFFVLKIIALTIAVWQASVGYPRHRRHDPFTCTEGRSAIMSVLYQLYMAVPFLWEVRVMTDWAVERTSLQLDSYLMIEDLHSIVFYRQCKIHETRVQQPLLGTAVRRSVKLRNGLLRLAILLLVLMGPLWYYSTFNPSMQREVVTQLRLKLSFMTSTSFYTSTSFTAEEVPGDWPLWLSRTRPSLAQREIMDPAKSLQLMSLSSCSSELWPISPQALRGLVQQLTDVVERKTTMYVFQSLELSRGRTSGPVTRTIRWTVSEDAARDILRTMGDDFAGEKDYVLLRNFYSPFVFLHEDGIDVYSNTEGRNIMDCSIQLRQEVDRILNSTVRYWCFKCQSLFTGGNVPNDNTTRFPEWGCLSTGEGCEKYDLELRNGDTDYNPVPMYFVLLSDPSISGVPFLEGIGIIALYTTFVLAVARLFRGMFTDKAKHTILCDMADPTPVAQLIEYIALARECGDTRLEQAVYFELLDLLRSPERLLRLTGFSRRLYDAETHALRLPSSFRSTRGCDRCEGRQQEQ